MLRLDLTKCSIDIVRLQELAKRCVASGGMLTGDWRLKQSDS